MDSLGNIKLWPAASDSGIMPIALSTVSGLEKGLMGSVGGTFIDHVNQLSHGLSDSSFRFQPAKANLWTNFPLLAQQTLIQTHAQPGQP
jgi:hypothetical protein